MSESEIVRDTELAAEITAACAEIDDAIPESDLAPALPSAGKKGSLLADALGYIKRALGTSRVSERGAIKLLTTLTFDHAAGVIDNVFAASVVKTFCKMDAELAPVFHNFLTSLVKSMINDADYSPPTAKGGDASGLLARARSEAAMLLKRSSEVLAHHAVYYVKGWRLGNARNS